MITKSLQTAVATAILKFKRMKARVLCFADAPGTTEDFRNTAELASRTDALPFDQDTIIVCPHPLGLEGHFLIQLVPADAGEFVTDPVPGMKVCIAAILLVEGEEATVIGTNSFMLKRRLLSPDFAESLRSQSRDWIVGYAAQFGFSVSNALDAWLEAAYRSDGSWVAVRMANYLDVYKEAGFGNESLFDGFILSISPLLSPCGYTKLCSSFRDGIGSDLQRNLTRKIPIYTLYRHNRIYIEPDDATSQRLVPLLRAAHHRDEHYRFPWKKHGIDRLMLPRSADERKALAEAIGIRPIKVRGCEVSEVRILPEDSNCIHAYQGEAEAQL